MVERWERLRDPGLRGYDSRDYNTGLNMGGAPQAGLRFYDFYGTTYTNYSGTMNADGKVTMTLSRGDYRFRADKDGQQYWSGAVNHCMIPGCVTAAITLPGGGAAVVTTTITYILRSAQDRLTIPFTD